MWREENGYLVQEFKFVDFKSALKFVNQVGELAEAANHHPDIEFGWGRVKILLRTHSEDSITERDQKLAKEIDDVENQS
jgi:4a-hydroxytetrahydrobiopterin dehydratase